MCVGRAAVAKGVLWALGPAAVWLLTGPISAHAEGANVVPKELHWWEIATGVLGVPAAAIALVYAYILIRKTNIESRKAEIEIRKLELEIREKQAGLAETDKEKPQDAAAVGEIIRPIAENRSAMFILLRFVMLSLLILLWRAIGVSPFIRTALIGSFYLFGWEDPQEHLFLLIGAYILAAIPELLFFVLTLYIGIPLFLDTNRLLGIDIKSLFWPFKKQS